MEIVILFVIGLLVFFESDLKDFSVAKVTKVEANYKTQFTSLKVVTDQESKFEIVNKNGVWIFSPAQKKNQINMIEVKKQRLLEEFITLPDGSKIEKGI